MKKLILLIVALVSLSQAAATYAQLVAWFDYNTTDTSAVTFRERVLYGLGDQCAKIQQGEIVRADLDSSHTFTDAQMKEFAARVVRGLYTKALLKHFGSENQIQNNGLETTDNLIRDVFKEVVWAIISQIGTGPY
jgi:hypothetical protein